MDESSEYEMTLEEVLNCEEHLIDEANAVFGDIDTDSCTYPSGYLKRQAVFVCKTCNQSPESGICLGCSLVCHSDHELEELYTKRNFRCDCGNSKFKGKRCQLFENKDAINLKNQYSQNFYARYCTCHSRYPDPQYPDQDMAQCIICEDWFHLLHLSLTLSSSDTDDYEIICDGCISSKPLLQIILRSLPPDILNKTASQINESVDDSFSAVCFSNKISSSPSSIDSMSKSICLPAEWRQYICTCEKCIEFLQKSGLEYLADPDDTLASYNKKGVTKTEEYADNAVKQINKCDPFVTLQVETEYQNMASELKEYLTKFVELKKTVTKDDIEEFFALYKSKKMENQIINGTYP